MGDAAIDAQVERQVADLAGRLRAVRLGRSLSQMELSLRAGLSKNMVNWIETGKIAPTVATLFKICNALDASPAALFDVPDAGRARARETVLDLVARYM